jgi:hypothetical protein
VDGSIVCKSLKLEVFREGSIGFSGNEDNTQFCYALLGMVYKCRAVAMGMGRP